MQEATQPPDAEEVEAKGDESEEAEKTVDRDSQPIVPRRRRTRRRAAKTATKQRKTAQIFRSDASDNEEEPSMEKKYRTNFDVCFYSCKFNFHLTMCRLGWHRDEHD